MTPEDDQRRAFLQRLDPLELNPTLEEMAVQVAKIAVREGRDYLDALDVERRAHWYAACWTPPPTALEALFGVWRGRYHAVRERAFQNISAMARDMLIEHYAMALLEDEFAGRDAAEASPAAPTPDGTVPPRP